MARGFRLRRRRYGRRLKLSRRSILLRRRLLIRKRIKRFVNKMGYPSYVKMMGMTESKSLLLRKTLALNTPYTIQESDGNPGTNIYQIILNPLECPNINKVFTEMGFQGSNNDELNYTRIFKYDYIRIKSIFISIKPAQSISTNNGTANTYYSDDGQSVSNAYAYFTYRYPILAPNDTKEIIQSMYGTNPNRDRIVNEGRLKNTYTWPTNKPMTISINKLYYRVNSEPYKLCSNTPLDIQYLRSLADSNSVGIYDPFDFKSLAPNLDDDDSSDDDNNESGNDNHEKKHNKKRNMMDEISLDDPQYSATFNGGSRGDVDIPDVQLVNYDLFFGRLVIVSPKNVRFTAEICYDCTLVR